MNLRRTALGVLLAAACERGGGTPVVPPTEAGGGGGPEPATALVEAAGRGTNEDDAFGSARRELAERLLGDARWLDVLALEVYERSSALEEQRLPGGEVEVRLRLTDSQAAAILTAFGVARVQITAPRPWRDTLVAYLSAHANEQSCLRRRALFDVECETGTTGDADAALAELRRGVTLAPTLRSGFPLDGEGKPLRKPSVFVFWHGTAVEDAPVRFGDMVVYTDAQGRAEAKTWVDRAVLDVGALLGPEQDAWPTAAIPILERDLDPKRWTLAIAEDGKTLAGAPRAAFIAALRKAGFPAPVEVKRLPVADVGTLVDATAGEVDMLVTIDLSSSFASRAGGGRVWYEAKGRVTAQNPWIPRRPWFAKDLTATASGVGDARAEEAVRKQFCQDAAEALAAAL